MGAQSRTARTEAHHPDPDGNNSALPDVEGVTEFVGAEIARCTGLIAEYSAVLEGLGRRSFAQTSELTTDAGAIALLDAAHRIRSLVLHALSVLVDLQYQAGRLDCLAAITRAQADEATGH